jgi:hypothetical protein
MMKRKANWVAWGLAAVLAVSAGFASTKHLAIKVGQQ